MNDSDNFYVKCPLCQGTLEINKRTEKVVQKWKATLPKDTSSDDKFSAALKKLKDQKDSTAARFKQAQNDVQERKKKAEELVKQGAQKIQEEGGKVEPQTRPIDLD